MSYCCAGNTALSGMPGLSKILSSNQVTQQREKNRRGEEKEQKKRAERVNQQQYAQSDCYSLT